MRNRVWKALCLSVCLALCGCGNGVDADAVGALIERFYLEKLYMLKAESRLDTRLNGEDTVTEIAFEKNAQKTSDGTEYYSAKGEVVINGELRASPELFYYSANGFLYKGGSSYSVNAPKEDYDKLEYASFCYTLTDPFLPTERDLKKAKAHTDEQGRTVIEIEKPSDELLSALSEIVGDAPRGVSFRYTVSEGRLYAYGVSYTVSASDGTELTYRTDVTVSCAGDEVPVLDMQTDVSEYYESEDVFE